MIDDAELAAMRRDMRRRIACPVPWCDGRWLDHGGDGCAPDEWLHTDGGIDLPHGASLLRSQIGASPVEWSLAIDGDSGSMSVYQDTDPATFAHRLRQIADAIDAARM